jgi:anti-sigma-K factor RskA
MPEHDAHNRAGLHPDVAGWVLQALDHDDAMRFVAHLHRCEECRAAVAELRPVAQAMTQAAPALEPPADLGARTLVAVQQAAAAEPRQAKAAAQGTKWRRWSRGTSLVSAAWALAGAAAAVIVIVAVFVLPGHSGGLPAQALTIQLASLPGSGQTASGTAVARRDASGSWDITLTVHHLKNFGDAKWYQCWYVSRDGRVASAGTFLVPDRGGGTFSMTSAVDPHDFRRMEIRLQPPNNNGAFQKGTVVLSGTVKTP